MCVVRRVFSTHWLIILRDSDSLKSGCKTEQYPDPQAPVIPPIGGLMLKPAIVLERYSVTNVALDPQSVFVSPCSITPYQRGQLGMCCGIFV